MRGKEFIERGLTLGGVAGLLFLGFVFGRASDTPTEAPPVSLIISPSCLTTDNVLTIYPTETIERISKHALFSQSGGITIDVDRKHHAFILNCVPTPQE